MCLIFIYSKLSLQISKLSSQFQPTVYRQLTDRLPTDGRQSADSRLTDRYHCGKTCRPTVGRLLADSWPTVGGGELFFTFTKSSMDNNNNANLLNITYGKYPKLCEKNMTRNVNNNTVGNTHQSAIEMQVKSKS